MTCKQRRWRHGTTCTGARFDGFRAGIWPRFAGFAQARSLLGTRSMRADAASLSRPPAAGDVLDGRYRIVRPIARGGMGTVFLAEHTLLKRRLVIKILHP